MTAFGTSSGWAERPPLGLAAVKRPGRRRPKPDGADQSHKKWRSNAFLTIGHSPPCDARLTIADASARKDGSGSRRRQMPGLMPLGQGRSRSSVTCNHQCCSAAIPPLHSTGNALVFLYRPSSSPGASPEPTSGFLTCEMRLNDRVWGLANMEAVRKRRRSSGP